MRKTILLVAVALLLPSNLAFAQTAAPPAPPAPAPAPSAGAHVEISTMRILRDKGIITQAEYDAAMRDMADSIGARAANANSLVVGKWSTTMYGFVEEDTIYDSTQSFQDLAGNAQVQRPGPVPYPDGHTHYAADHGRLMMSIRNSRVGFRMRAPESNGIRVSGQLELDLLGNQPGTPEPQYASGQAARYPEGSFFTSPTMRVRHANLRIETPVLDILVGQYWDLFGWQSVYHPNTVEIQGVVGQVYSRTPQVRLSKTVKTDAITFEAAIAAVRPPQRNSETPETQGGLRFAVNKWTGMSTNGATATSIMPFSVAVTGDYRHYGLPEFAQIPTKEVGKDTTAIAIDAFIPVIPASEQKKGNSLSLNGEFVTGYGMADLYTGLTGGMTMPSVPNTARINPAPLYPQDVDNGLVVFDTNGGLHGIQWTTYLFGAQYYLPSFDGKVFVSGNYSHVQSANTPNFVNYTATTNPANANYAYSTAFPGRATRLT